MLVALRSSLFALVIAALIVITSNTAVSAQRGAASVTLQVAGIPQPFASNCVDSETGGFGVNVRALIQLTAQTSLGLTFAHAVEGPEPTCALVPTVPGEGIHRRRTFAPGRSDQLTTFALEAGLQPRALRVLRLSGLAGFETGSEVPFLGTRLDLRIGRRIGFLASGELLWLHTPSIVRQDEYRGGQLIDSTIVERDHVWQRAIRIGLGAELSFR